ncbi:MAG: sulfite exporter TauE/SafE family protein [Pseudomonadales bacterium]|nr:sulfite exporter TauE/SafE family protein [Pseudomonadales bacterium]
MLTVLALYLAVGAIAGLVAGLFGVGGGVIIVPALIYAFAMQGMPTLVLTHMAVGTSLAIICVTSISSVSSHHKNGFVLWPVVKSMAPGLVFGVMVGVYTVVNIPGPLLQLIMGCFLSLIAVQMGFNVMPKGERALPAKIGLTGFGFFSGWVSALFGIGGGSLNVPFLSFFSTPMQKAVATAAACGMPIAIAGAIGNIVAGWGDTATPDWSLGFIYLPAFIGIAAMAAPFAKLGATLAKKLKATTLKRIFAIFLVIIGQSMIFKSLGIL